MFSGRTIYVIGLLHLGAGDDRGQSPYHTRPSILIKRAQKSAPFPGRAPDVRARLHLWVGMWWRSRRDLRRWDERHAAYTREQELKRQLWEMEAQIREERLSEEEREWRRRSREEQAAVRREARRRPGLPDEEG
jgi:hypothetical protein